MDVAPWPPMHLESDIVLFQFREIQRLQETEEGTNPGLLPSFIWMLFSYFSVRLDLRREIALSNS